MSTNLFTSQTNYQPASAAGDTENRSVTIMMADLGSSTDYLEAMGSELFANLLRRFHSLSSAAVRRHSGVVGQYQGDGIICYFGHPTASENDAMSACRAALDILEDLSDESGPEAIAVRIGIASGTVMMRTDGDQFGTNAIGRPINLAARLEAQANINTALICQDTAKLVGGQFRTKDLGATRLKGFAEPQSILQILSERNANTTRFESLHGRCKSSSLEGRQEALNKLEARFDSVSATQGASAFIVADAGMGKSRLLAEFLALPALQKVPAFVLQSAPEHQTTELYPVLRYLSWIAGVQRRDSAEVQHDKIKRIIIHVWGSSGEEVDILLELLSPLGAETPIDQTLSVPFRRGRALNLLVDKFLASMIERTIPLVVFEDAHWLDPTSGQFLEILLQRTSSLGAFVLVTARFGAQLPQGFSGVERIHLEALSDAESRRLAVAIFGGNQQPDAVLDRLVEKSEGVPLFVQEFAEMLNKSTKVGRSADTIPLSLSGILQAKMDLLSAPARALIKTGSALGRTFHLGLAQRVTNTGPSDDEAVARMVKEFERLNIAHLDGNNRMLFAHALVQDAIYASMTQSGRQTRHRGIVNDMANSEENLRPEPHILAWHYERAGDYAAAGHHFFLAGIASAGRGAAGEALAHLEDGLKAVSHMKSGSARDQLELQLLSVRGPTLMVTRGPGNPDFGATQAKAMDLVNRLGNHNDMVPVIYNSALNAWAVADLDRALSTAREINDIYRQSPTDAAYLSSNTMRGLIFWHQGNNVMALEALSATTTRHDPKVHGPLYGQFLKEFGVFSHFYTGLTHAVMDNHQAAAESADRAIALADTLGFPHARGFALLAQFNTALLAGDIEKTQKTSSQAFEFASSQGFPEFAAMATFAKGWTKTQTGDQSAGIDDMREGLEAWAATGFMCWQALFAGFLGRELVRAEQYESAETLITDYLTKVESSGERQMLPLLLLALSELQAKQGDIAAARAAKDEGLVVAEQQEGLLWVSALEQHRV